MIKTMLIVAFGLLCCVAAKQCVQESPGPCGCCRPGKLNHAIDICNGKGDSCNKCGGFLGDGYCDECVGVVYTTLAGQTSFFPGCGDFIPPSGGARMCPKELMGQHEDSGNSSNVVYGSYVFYLAAYHPVLLDNGLLQGGHKQLDLGRRGRCAADLGVKMLGEVLGKPVTVESIGQCCDLCYEHTACVGWSVSGTDCSLLQATTGHREACEDCFSGLNLANPVSLTSATVAV